MGEVDHSNDALNHRLADGVQGIRAANVEAVNQHLEEVIDVRHYKAPKNLRRISLVESFSGLCCMGFNPLRTQVICQRTAGDGFKDFQVGRFPDHESAAPCASNNDR